jgi:hypothetical protein
MGRRRAGRTPRAPEPTVNDAAARVNERGRSCGGAESHLTPTHAAVGCHVLLGEAVSAAAKAAFVRAAHPFRLTKLERDLRVFEFLQVQALLRLKNEERDPRQ